MIRLPCAAAPPATARTRVLLRAALLGAVVLAVSGVHPHPLLSAPPPTAPATLTEAEADAVLARFHAELASNNPVTLDWRTMAALNYRTGDMPANLRQLNGRQVRVPGFMVPLEDWEEQVTEFILVPFFGACIHVPPPPPNQMVHVLMQRNRRVQVNLWDPVWVIGTLKIENVESPYGVIGYQISAERLTPYEG
jgi:uncharacterized protein